MITIDLKLILNIKSSPVKNKLRMREREINYGVSLIYLFEEDYERVDWEREKGDDSQIDE